MPKTRKARAVGLNHIALEVDDIEEALAFYGRLFEFTLRGKSDEMAFIDLGDQFLALQTEREQRHVDLRLAVGVAGAFVAAEGASELHLTFYLWPKVREGAGKELGETRTDALMSQPETGKISCVHHPPYARLSPDTPHL